MSSVRDASQAMRREILAQQARGQSELNKLSERQERELEAAKAAHRADVANLKTQHQVELEEEAKNREEKLLMVRDSLERTKNITEAEAKRLAAQGAAQRETTREAQQQEQQLLTQRHEERIMEQNHRFNQGLRDLNEKERRHTAELVDQHRAEQANQQNLWKNKIQQQRAQFSETHAKEGAKFEHLKSGTERQQRQEVLGLHRQHQSQLGEMGKRHVKEQEKLTNHHQGTLYSREAFFEKKYQDQMKQQEALTKDLEARHAKVQAASRESLLKRVEADEARSGDPFFRFTELRPEVRELPDAYELKVKVPDYAKEEVLLSANTKELVLTFNRRHRDERKVEGGGVERVDRVESTVNRIPVNAPLDGRKMTRTWDDGTLTFVVKKA